MDDVGYDDGQKHHSTKQCRVNSKLLIELDTRTHECVVIVYATQTEDRRGHMAVHVAGTELKYMCAIITRIRFD